MPDEKNKILKFIQWLNLSKHHFFFMPILNLLIKKVDECKNDLEKSSTTKTGERTASGYSMLMKRTFDDEKINMMYAERTDCMKKFRGLLKVHAIKKLTLKKVK